MGDSNSLESLSGPDEYITMEEEIKQKMRTIRAKWEGKSEKFDTGMEHTRRTIDRMIYRELQKQLNKLGIHGATVVPPEEDVVAMAERIFDIK